MSDKAPDLGDVMLAINGLREDVRDDLGTLRGDIGTLRGAIDTLRMDLSQRLDRQQDALTSIRDDISVAMGRADYAADLTKNLRSEVQGLSDQLTAVVRQVRRLQTEMRELKGDP
jgi:methyl-accepting chemotaxis protein